MLTPGWLIFSCRAAWVILWRSATSQKTRRFQCACSAVLHSMPVPSSYRDCRAQLSSFVMGERAARVAETGKPMVSRSTVLLAGASDGMHRARGDLRVDGVPNPWG